VSVAATAAEAVAAAGIFTAHCSCFCPLGYTMALACGEQPKHNTMPAAGFAVAGNMVTTTCSLAATIASAATASTAAAAKAAAAWQQRQFTHNQ